jgi:carboxypeptidase Q
MHRTIRLAGLSLLLGLAPAVASAQGPITAQYRAAADRIIDAALKDSVAYRRLTELTDKFGNRFSGTDSLEKAIDWTLDQMKKDGLANVRGEPAMVPHWVRGKESAELVSPRHAKLPMLGLGGSIATPKDGITAPVLVVSSFDELTQKAAEAKGKIIVFDPPWKDYGFNVQYRGGGASAAARVGAVAALVRSASSYSMRTPHTGGMRYDSTVAKVPTAALTAEDAAMLHRMQTRGEKIVITLRMEAQMLPDTPSRNAIAELRGSEKPEEIVVMGGHIDSWDVGNGAMDDGGGVVVAWEALNLLKKLGLTPRRTIRVVGWTNEENGGRGGQAYRAAHKDEPHVLAMESDEGVFSPLGFGFTGSDSARVIVTQVGALLERIGAGEIGKSGGGADIGPMMQIGVPGMGLDVDGTKYFWFHHTEADTIDKLDPAEMQRCVATMAVMAYVVADLPAPLPR